MEKNKNRVNIKQPTTKTETGARGSKSLGDAAIPLRGSGMMTSLPERFPGVGVKHALRKSQRLQAGKGQRLPNAASASSHLSL